MNEPSEEQQKVINALKDNKNVVVDSCAGSGKTTTVGVCANSLPLLKFLLVTFNKQLKDDVVASFKKYEVENVDTFTYHGLAVKHYSNECHNDMGLRRILRNNTEPRYTKTYDIVVIDESQDMSLIYFKFIWKFITDMNNPVLLLILGDEKQCVYEFKGADPRFLTKAEECWSTMPLLKTNEFTKCKLMTCHRITDPMCRFINTNLLGYNRIHSCKIGRPVVYLKRSKYTFPDVIQTWIKNLIKNEKCKYGDFMILIPSTKNSIAKMVENKLVESNIPCFYPSYDSENLDASLIQNKVTFSTFHSSKGRQRDHIFILGFDETYMTIYSGQNKERNVCPNEIYVACSRGIISLHVFQDKDTNMLPFIKTSQSTMIKSREDIHFQGVPTSNLIVEEKREQTSEVKKINSDASGFTRFINEDVLDMISPLLDEIFVTVTPSDEENALDIQSIHETYNDTFEDVSDINGTILPIMFVDRLKEECNIEKKPILQMMINNDLMADEKGRYQYLRELAETMPEQCDTISDYLFVGCLYAAVSNKTYSRVKQIPRDNYTWLSEEMITQTIERLRNTIGTKCDSNWCPEYTLIHRESDEEHMMIDKLLSPYLKKNQVYRFTCRCDIATESSFWELKCTSQLTVEHKIQLVLYAWLYQNKGYGLLDGNKKEKEFHLFNFKTHEHLQLKATTEQLNQIIVEVVKGKQVKSYLNDEEFLSSLFI